MGALVFSSDTASTGTTTHTAPETADAPTGADDLRINAGVTVSVEDGDLILQAGDDIILRDDSQAIASGDVTLTAGFNDLDQLGQIVLNRATVQGTNVTFNAIHDIFAGRIVASSRVSLNSDQGAIIDTNRGVSTDITALVVELSALAGIGTLDHPFTTQVANLEARTGSGGIFVENTGNLTIGGVDGGLTGLSVETAGTIRVVNFGTLVLADTDGPEIVNGGSASGNVTTLVAAGDTADLSVAVNRNAITTGGDAFMTAGRDLLLGTAGFNFDNDVRANGSIELRGLRDITVDGDADVVSDAFGNDTGGDLIITAGRGLNITGNNGNHASVGARGTGDVSIRADVLNLTSPLTDAIFSVSGNVIVDADRVLISSASGITAPGGLVMIKATTPGYIDVGSTTDAALGLELSDAELDRIFAGGLLIGGLGTAEIAVTADIDPANVGNLFFEARDIAVSPGITVTASANLEFISSDDFTLGAGATLQAGVAPGSQITIFVDSGFGVDGGGTADLRNGTAIGPVQVFGNVDGDTLLGGVSDEQFTGAGGNDEIDGGGGSDTAGYSGNSSDYSFVELPSGDLQVIDNRGGAPDGTDLVRNVESFEFANGTFARDSLPNLATPGPDVLIGDGGSNTLHGLGGDDQVIGNAGNDSLSGDAGDDRITGGGDDDTMSGGDGVDQMYGGTGNDTMRGDEGDDRMSGDDGDDLIFGGAGNDRLEGGNGDDNMFGDDGGDTVNGGAGNDRITGGAGDDVLTGGAGRDQLVGSAGADRFDFNAVSESVVGAGRDVVYFAQSDSDRIDVSTIDANATVAGNQAFTFLGAAVFSGIAGQLRFSGGVLQGDVNGDRNADFEVRTVGTVSGGDIIL